MGVDTSDSRLGSLWGSVARTFSNTEVLSRYSLVAQKQSGSRSDFSQAVIYPDGWRPVWKAGDGFELSLNGASVETPLDTDKVFGIIMKQN
jgi:hypothetical protein